MEIAEVTKARAAKKIPEHFHKVLDGYQCMADSYGLWKNEPDAIGRVNPQTRIGFIADYTIGMMVQDYEDYNKYGYRPKYQRNYWNTERFWDVMEKTEELESYADATGENIPEYFKVELKKYTDWAMRKWRTQGRKRE